MSEWKDGILSDIAEIVMGQSPAGENCSNKNIGFPLLNGPSEFKNHSPIPVQFTNDPKRKSQKGDILFCVRGSTGKMNWSDQIYAIGRGLAAIRHKSGTHLNIYIRGIIENSLEELLQNATGSIFSNVSRTDIGNIQIEIPPLQEQERIAEVLSSLDDKIHLLHRNNKTLEQLAETLFRQWFVEETEDSKLSDEFNVIMGQSPPGDTYNQTGNGIIFYQGRTDFGFRFPKPRVYCTHPARFAESLDTLMSVRAPVGDINYAAEKCCIGRGIAAIRHKNKDIHHSYTYYLMKHLRSDFDVHEDTGTIFGSINKEELLNIKCPKLDINNISYFNSSIGSLDDKLVSNCKQIQQLETLRDTLLPKLMSGVVRVEN
jgi:type I restriction enzyme S subunit